MTDSEKDTEKRLLAIGKKYLQKLLKRGEIDEEMYNTSLAAMTEHPEAFTAAPVAAETDDELLPFGRTFEAVLARRNDAEAAGVEDYELLSNLAAIVMVKEEREGMAALSTLERQVWVLDGMQREVSRA